MHHKYFCHGRIALLFISTFCAINPLVAAYFYRYACVVAELSCMPWLLSSCKIRTLDVDIPWKVLSGIYHGIILYLLLRYILLSWSPQLLPSLDYVFVLATVRTFSIYSD